ncbi:MAG: autotransporter outer membrane beta-barrel domain-containing protein, partial [Phascolarctobacterium sp.]|nr:autotransporter outer membrane beta-barrel domain-containing protein [Phascolarctobacterium sp.]
IKLKITRVGTNDQALVIGESRAAATAFANQGSELIEIGLDTLARDKSDKETKVFASVYGNTSEYATGSHVKVNGWSGIVGVAKTNDDGLTTGAFFENGEGNYRTFNNFEGFLMRGDGEANYNGGGFFARKDNANGVYTEASLRAGNLQNELRKAVITDSKLEGYDIDTFYYGAHVGVGRIIPRGNEGDSIDVYGKFIYTHHDSEDFAIGGDNFHFDSIDSERLRLGFRINEVQNDKLSMYYGAAWEYEFNGDANNTVIGYDISTPSLGGSTVIGEIGAHYKANEKWTFDANMRGYAGQRDGFTGSIQANYLF